MLSELNDKFYSAEGRYPMVYIETYGCQQNEADSERILGILTSSGYEITQDKQKSDLILVNTCAVREHAELKALSNTGNLKHLKETNPNLIIGVCGCMIQQEHRADDIKHKYPYVDFVFGTNMMHQIANIVYTARMKKGRGFFVEDYQINPGTMREDIPVVRESSYKAWVSTMYGCNNFCSYCVVPYVRGRERSRKKEMIVSEIRSLVEQGYREITLLGQNVNSYGKDLYGKAEFGSLLRDICKIEGNFWIRFMTSHPKDATEELCEIISENPKISNHFHLPMQSGSNDILKAMHRGYTREEYFRYIDLLRAKIPDICITSDFIVGFPGETEQDFELTLDALKRIKFDQVYSFVYSKRKGTPAEKMADQIPEQVKKERITRLLEIQGEISGENNKKYEGKTVSVLVEGESKTDPDMFTGRCYHNKLVHFKKPQNAQDIIGTFVDIKIEKGDAFSMKGNIIQ
ncbi:MAG: tRNA (N6-isopentenyl adenosine(37)-C2)-methylthiotransferase MiaB [Clostridia bacterium]|nr:tRNA (N6-isopentenyl adenosine(37)-C2)-methylthiotransferase MiaB [Clostridia bacterium]